MKIFTTAMLMYVVLGKRLSSKQWIALTLLVMGIGLAHDWEIPISGVIDVQLVYSPPAENENVEQKPILGFISVISMCFTSAFAGVYLEKVLKQSEVSVWMQNIRLAVLGLPISLFSMWLYDWETIHSRESGNTILELQTSAKKGRPRHLKGCAQWPDGRGVRSVGEGIRRRRSRNPGVGFTGGQCDRAKCTQVFSCSLRSFEGSHFETASATSRE